jgi:hypothetical protein
MICKTKCRINSKCSKCCEVNIDFEEGPKNCDTPLQENKISDNIFIISDKKNINNIKLRTITTNL